MKQRPAASSEVIRVRMTRQRQRDTAPEMKVRRLLHAQGFRYRVDFRPDPALRVRADIVFTKRRWAVFIDGCYWHGCPVHGTSPKTNADWWREKLAANKARDRRHTDDLQARGWSVLRFWEHEDPEKVVDRIRQQHPG